MLLLLGSQRGGGHYCGRARRGQRKLTDGVPLHAAPVTALVAFAAFAEEGPCVLSAGKDGKIKLLGAELDLKYEFDMAKKEYGAFKRGFASACLNADGRKLLVGTVGSEIFELSNDEESQADMNGASLVTGHCKDELWGLAVHPHQEEFCTVGDDKALRV